MNYRYPILVLVLTVVGIWMAVFSLPDNNLSIISCDVGQGDATLFLYKTTQILVDAGEGKKVNKCLGKYIPFWDKNLELVVITHPEHDHMGGLNEVFARYNPGIIITSGINPGSPEFQALENLVGGT